MVSRPPAFPPDGRALPAGFGCALSLKEPEADGLTLRRERPQIPPKGRSLVPVPDALCPWGGERRPCAGGGQGPDT